jgi:L-ascorbate metabolism protein UlaG (beta-lactamase superfamily)
MKGVLPLALLIAASGAWSQTGGDPEGSDVLCFPGGELRITFIGHGTLMFEWKGWIIHVDPVGQEADYTKLPKADLVLVTHEHTDHLDAKAVASIRKEGTRVLANEAAAKALPGAEAVSNGETRTIGGVKIQAVAAYNTTAGRERFHPKGRGNGYLLDFAGQRVYVAGDTEVTPEMLALEDIAVAFLPMNQPYTMTPEQVAEAARVMRPRILYPYHYGETDPARLLALLRDTPEVEVRIRDLR